MGSVPELEEQVGRRPRVQRWTVVAAIGWVLGLVLLWGSGLSYVPAVPRCDYSTQTSSIEIGPARGAPHSAVVERWSGDLETTWAPPGTSCPHGHGLAAEQARRGGPRTEAWVLQVLLLVAPIALWWAAGRGGSVVAVRRKLAVVLAVGGTWLAAIGVWSIVTGSAGLAVACLVWALVLLAVGLGYRRRTRPAR